MPRAAIPVALVGLLCAACSTTTSGSKDLMVRTEYSRTARFSEWKSFRMATAQPSDPDYTRYPRYEKFVRDALVQELGARGYQRIQEGTPDFRVAFEVIFRGAGALAGYEGTRGAETDPRLASGSRPSGTIVVRMLDPVTAQVLWEGRASGIKVDAVSPEVNLRKAVWRILVEFPPIIG